jgi:hypothetical protein
MALEFAAGIWDNSVREPIAPGCVIEEGMG